MIIMIHNSMHMYACKEKEGMRGREKREERREKREERREKEGKRGREREMNIRNILLFKWAI